MSEKPPQYEIGCGTLQPYVRWFKESPSMVFFGIGQYDKTKPVLTDSLREQGQVIVDRLNCGEISESDARIELERIWI